MTISPLEECPDGYAMVPYTIDDHNSADPEFEILLVPPTAPESEFIAQATAATDIAENVLTTDTPDVYQDGSFDIIINHDSNIKEANMIVEISIMGAESVTFHYVDSDGVTSQTLTV